MAENATHGFTRRSFIKGAAALTATGALVGCSPQAKNLEETDKKQEAPETQLYPGVCRGNCGGGCFLNVHVRDGQVVRTSARDMPNTEYNRICPRGLTHVGRMYSSERVLYPMKRVGERGSSDFERISWDEALDTIAEKWKGYREEFGPKSIMLFYGSGNYALYSGSCNAIGAVVRFENILGCTDAGLDVDVGTGYGASRAHGGADLGNELTDRKNAKTQILWGNNPAISLPHTLHFMMEAKENGTRLIVIDPVYNPNTAKADWWIPVKPGTDGALALGVLNVLIGNGWVDEDTLRSKTNCGLLIKEDGMYLRMSDLGVEPTEGDVDPLTGKPKVINPPAVWDEAAGKAVAFSEAQKPALKNVAPIEGIAVQTVYENAMGYISAWTPEAASAVCGVSVEDIQELARVYHEDGPVTTEIMQGLNHYRNAHYTGWPVYLVGLLTGNAGKPGAAIGQSEEYLPQMLFSNVKGACYPVNSAGEPAPGISGHLDTTVFEEVFTTGKFKGEDYVVKSAYIHCSNPLVTMCNNDYTSRWIDALEFVVVADMCMTETCKYADIVLPAAHWFEQQDIGFLFSSHPYLLWQEKCVEPQGESKPDFQIFGDILDRLGLGEFWCTEDEYAETMLDSEYWKSLGCTLENIKAKGAVRIYPEGDKLGSADLLPTETGRIQLYQEVAVPSNVATTDFDISKERGLHWETPVYVGEDREYRKTYPFSLLSEHMRTHTHTQWWECGYVREFEREPVVRINPDDAAELGIAEGDTVRLSNDNGYVVMKAAISAGLPRKMISSGRSWQKDDFIDGHFANLSSKDYNAMIANQAFNDVAVMIEKL